MSQTRTAMRWVDPVVPYAHEPREWHVRRTSAVARATLHLVSWAHVSASWGYVQKTPSFVVPDYREELDSCSSSEMWGAGFGIEGHPWLGGRLGLGVRACFEEVPMTEDTGWVTPTGHVAGYAERRRDASLYLSMRASRAKAYVGVRRSETEGDWDYLWRWIELEQLDDTGVILGLAGRGERSAAFAELEFVDRVGVTLGIGWRF